MAEKESIKKNGWGGRRENQNGRPKLDITRKMRSTRAFDEEWDLARGGLRIIGSYEMKQEIYDIADR